MDKLDKYHYHELLDRLHVIMSNIDTHLTQHPVLELETEVNNLVEEAQTTLWEAYQLIGDKR
jgi:hypothetical protein